MASYKVVVVSAAETELRKVPFPFRRQINQRLMRLKDDPRPVDGEALSQDGIYRLSIHGWFALYRVFDETATVTTLTVVKH